MIKNCQLCMLLDCQNDFSLSDVKSNTELREDLKAYETDLDISSEEFNLQHFSYNNSGILELIFDHLDRTDYNGITV